MSAVQLLKQYTGKQYLDLHGNDLWISHKTKDPLLISRCFAVMHNEYLRNDASDDKVRAMHILECDAMMCAYSKPVLSQDYYILVRLSEYFRHKK